MPAMQVHQKDGMNQLQLFRVLPLP